ncbi:uncharacterized protein V1510DRAFT_417937, partial [Dipodascopsis tothii]|uniref:uncharacterized protein n=1 Tax=Dipodascopsis tothii TaxID=44089 RepID=UPI0034CD436F
MPYSLRLKAELAGVTGLAPADDESEPYAYTFKVQCTSCREVHPNEVFFNRFDTYELSGSRGTANFVWKCKACRREASASFVLQATKGKAAVRAYNADDSGKPQPVVDIETRGLELVEFLAAGNWICKGAESGTPFTDVSMDEGEWFDYDEKAGEEVSVTDVVWDIVRTQ